MDTWLTAAVTVALVFMAGVALVAIVKGRIPRRAARRGVRPRLWGYGTLLACAGMALFQYGSTVRGNTAVNTVFGSGMAVFLTGCVLQYLSVRPAESVSPPESPGA